MVMDYGRWDPCDFIVSPGVRGTTGYRSSRSGRTSVACQPLHNYQDQRSFSIAVGHLPSTKRNISKSTRNLSLSNRTYEIKNGDGRKRSVSQTSQRSRRASSYSYNQENTFHTRKLSRKLSKSTVTICFSNRTISNTNSNKSAYHSNGNLDDNTSTEVDRDSYNVPKSEEISIADKVEDQMLNGEVVEPLDVKVKENFLLTDKVKERLTFEDGLESRSSSCSIPRVRPQGLSSTRATLGLDTLSRNSRISTYSDGSMPGRSFCDEMSCCKSYLGKNNEVKEGEGDEVEEDRTRKKSSYDPMTSNLPECFFRCLIMTTFLAFYMCIGAAIFCAIEREEEKEHSREMIEMWKTFQEENSISREMMDKFLHKHYEMCEMGDHNHEGNNIQWDYVSSLFFTGTILTTIGYGHSSPATLGGRVFTIFYAIAGIPFMLGLLNVVAEILLTTLKIIKSKFKKKPYPDVFHHEVFISALACVVALLIFMTFVFKVQESSWTYEQSIYFSFITMTTIGFGDFVPAQANVENNSPTLITREFLNLILIFVSVLVWYFLSQVSAQVLKVHLKGLYRKLESSSSFFNKTNNKYPEIEANHQVDGDSDDPEIGPDRCTCNCTCGYDHMTDSASGVLDTHSAVSDRSMAEFQHPNNNLECIKDDDDGELDYDDQSSVSSVQSSEDNTSLNIDLTPRLQPDQVAEPSETPLKIPSIVITPVDPTAKLSSNTKKENAAYSTLLNSENVDHPCDSGKGSSEITTFTCQTNDIISNNISPSQSSDSLSSNSSGVFSDSLSKAGVYVNGGFMPSTPRMKRSKSEEVGSSSFISSISIGSKGIRRISRSLTDLAFSNKPYKHLDERRLSGVEYSRKVESFSIHTKVFDDMMKS